MWFHSQLEVGDCNWRLIKSFHVITKGRGGFRITVLGLAGADLDRTNVRGLGVAPRLSCNGGSLARSRTRNKKNR